MRLIRSKSRCIDFSRAALSSSRPSAIAMFSCPGKWWDLSRHHCGSDSAHLPPLAGQYARTRKRQNPCAAINLGRYVTVKKCHYKQKLAHSLHTVWPPTGTRPPGFGITALPSSAKQYACTTGQIHCSAMDLSISVRPYLRKKRFPQVSQGLASQSVTNRGEQMYYNPEPLQRNGSD